MQSGSQPCVPMTPFSKHRGARGGARSFPRVPPRRSFSHGGIRLILCLLLLTALVPRRVHASLIASSRIQYCTNDGSEPVACKKKMIVTLTVDAGQQAGTEEIVAVSTAADDTNNGASTQFAPVRLTTSRSLVRYRYPVFYVQAYNAKPYELIIPGTLFNQCNADFSANTATCGLAYNSDGTPIYMSQGFCCDCGICASLGLCEDDARAKSSCNLLNHYTQASCMRFGTRWYSGYSIGSASTYYTINVTMARNVTRQPEGNVATLEEERATLFLNPDSTGDANADFGVMARLIGDFNPTEQPLVLTQSMLFVPSLPRNDARVQAGPAEWMILDRGLVTLDGRTCNRVGVSYEAFASQGNACRLSTGSCLNSQLEDLRTIDMDAIAAGRKGQYMARSLGAFDEEQYADTPNRTATEGGTSDPYISYLASTPAATMITLTLSADDLQYVVAVATGRIVSLSMNMPTLVASTRDGEMRVEVQNTGAVTARFTVALQCDARIFPIAAQVVSLAAQQTQNLTFRVLVQRTDVDGEASCTATLRDSQEGVQDTSDASFGISGVQWNNGTQGGTNAPTNNSTQQGTSQARCDRCGFFNVSCSFTNVCTSLILRQFAVLLGVVVLLFIVFKFRHQLGSCFGGLFGCCCGGGNKKRKRNRRDSSTDDDSDASDSPNSARGGRSQYKKMLAMLIALQRERYAYEQQQQQFQFMPPPPFHQGALTTAASAAGHGPSSMPYAPYGGDARGVRGMDQRLAIEGPSMANAHYPNQQLPPSSYQHFANGRSNGYEGMPILPRASAPMLVAYHNDPYGPYDPEEASGNAHGQRVARHGSRSLSARPRHPRRARRQANGLNDSRHSHAAQRSAVGAAADAMPRSSMRRSSVFAGEDVMDEGAMGWSAQYGLPHYGTAASQGRGRTHSPVEELDEEDGAYDEDDFMDSGEEQWEEGSSYQEGSELDRDDYAPF